MALRNGRGEPQARVLGERLVQRLVVEGAVDEEPPWHRGEMVDERVIQVGGVDHRVLAAEREGRQGDGAPCPVPEEERAEREGRVGVPGQFPHQPGAGPLPAPQGVGAGAKEVLDVCSGAAGDQQPVRQRRQIRPVVGVLPDQLDTGVLGQLAAPEPVVPQAAVTAQEGQQGQRPGAVQGAHALGRARGALRVELRARPVDGAVRQTEAPGEIGGDTDVGTRVGRELRAADALSRRGALTAELQQDVPRVPAAAQRQDVRLSRQPTGHGGAEQLDEAVHGLVPGEVGGPGHGKCGGVEAHPVAGPGQRGGGGQRPDRGEGGVLGEEEAQPDEDGQRVMVEVGALTGPEQGERVGGERQ